MAIGVAIRTRNQFWLIRKWNNNQSRNSLVTYSNISKRCESNDLHRSWEQLVRYPDGFDHKRYNSKTTLINFGKQIFACVVIDRLNYGDLLGNNYFIYSWISKMYTYDIVRYIDMTFVHQRPLVVNIVTRSRNIYFMRNVKPGWSNTIDWYAATDTICWCLRGPMKLICPYHTIGDPGVSSRKLYKKL